MTKNKHAGKIFQIPLENGTYGFGRILDNVATAFYDLNTEIIPSIEEIIQAKVLFKVPVMNYAFSSKEWKEKWKIIGQEPLDNKLKEDIIFCRQDFISKKCYLYFENGVEEETTCEECAKYEIAAVWDPKHIEDRLLDHFMDRPCIWLEDGIKIQN